MVDAAEYGYLPFAHLPHPALSAECTNTLMEQLTAAPQAALDDPLMGRPRFAGPVGP